MGKFLKFAIGVAVLGFVGLVGLSVMSIVAALVLGRSSSHQLVASDEVPALVESQPVFPRNQAQAERESAELLAWAGPDDSARASQSGQLAQVQVTVHESWIDAASPFVGIILLFGMPAIIFIVIRSMRRGRATIPSDDTALVHELARRAQDLSQRMEALETILLDRTRAAR